MTGSAAQVKEAPQRLIGVQYLRAIAALQVVLYHFTQAGGQAVSLGGFGVPLFFVISGFLMVTITDEETSPAAFVRDRAIRIVPLYWLATSVRALFSLRAGGLDLRHLAASYAFMPWPLASSERHFFPILNVGWTLNYEAFFYGLFAVSLLLPARYRIAALTVAFASLVSVGVAAGESLGVARFWTEPVILQFLAGAWLGRWWIRRGSIGWPLLGCAIAGGLMAVSTTPDFRGALWGCLVGVLAMLLVLAGERRNWFERSFGPGVLLGDASYSMYLWHPLVLLVMWGAHPSFWGYVVVGIPLSIVVGLLSYVLIERPLLRYFRIRRRAKGVIVPSF